MVASVMLIWLCFVAAPSAPAESTSSVPRLSLTGGVGNSLGWFGVQGEHYLREGRFSIFAGVGYATNFEEPSAPDISGTVAVAGGSRAFFGGRKHRLFVEGSISLVAREWWLDEHGSEHEASRYGPGLQVGYQLLSRKGVTFATSVGVGYAVGARSDSTTWLFGLGVGYTWRDH
jgi:hypothetical protein